MSVDECTKTNIFLYCFINQTDLVTYGTRPTHGEQLKAEAIYVSNIVTIYNK